MKDKLNQWIANLNGQFVEVSSKTALYQCMDLAYDWVFALGYPKATIQNTYAYQVYTAPKDITRQYFDLIENTPTAIPNDGDLVVWSNALGVAGHIGIALGGGTTSKFLCFNQNYPLGTNAHIQEFSYTNVLGWLRPKILPVTNPVSIISNDADKIDFKNFTTPLEVYGVLELGLLKAKLLAKDQRIKQLEETPPAPIFSKPIAKLYYELAKEFDK